MSIRFITQFTTQQSSLYSSYWGGVPPGYPGIFPLLGLEYQPAPRRGSTERKHTRVPFVPLSSRPATRVPGTGNLINRARCRFGASIGKQAITEYTFPGTRVPTTVAFLFSTRAPPSQTYPGTKEEGHGVLRVKKCLRRSGRWKTTGVPGYGPRSIWVPGYSLGLATPGPPGSSHVPGTRVTRVPTLLRIL
eukprot:1233603-Rhodomonas_salina.1